MTTKAERAEGLVVAISCMRKRAKQLDSRLRKNNATDVVATKAEYDSLVKAIAALTDEQIDAKP